MPNILPENFVVQRSVPIYGITQLGLRSHPTGSSTLEALTTLSFIRSDKLVFNTPVFRPCSPCYPTQAVAEPIVSHIRNPYLTFPGGVHHFHRRLNPGLGSPHGGFSDYGCIDPFRTRAPHQCTGAQGFNIGPQSLGYSITGPSARMEALMQHYQAAEFSTEVSEPQFAAAPTCRRPSTDRMYDDRWLRFTTLGRGRGFDQTIKGYRSCLASVLSRTGRAAEV